MIDRDKASTLGVSAQQVEDALFTAYASRQVSDILTPNNEYHVIMELAPQYQMDPSILPLLYIRSSQGALVPLESMTIKLTPSVGPLTINHSGQTTSVTLSFNLKPNVALGEAVKTVEKLARETLPPTITGSFQGSAQAFQRSEQGLGILLLMAILVVYILLGILYESFIHPLTILSGLPSAGVGALVTLILFHKDLNIYAFVGIIMLIGIVKKNAIMMIDFALDAERKQGKSCRSNLPRLSYPVSPDHDDYDGGHDGRLADCSRVWSWRSCAPTLGTRGGGRSGVLAGYYSLHYAGYLYLSRGVPV